MIKAEFVDKKPMVRIKRVDSEKVLGVPHFLDTLDIAPQPVFAMGKYTLLDPRFYRKGMCE